MSIIEIPDQTLSRLRKNAEARQMTLADYLKSIAEQFPATADAKRQLASIKAFATLMGAWTDQHVPACHTVDDSRESIYGDRG